MDAAGPLAVVKLAETSAMLFSNELVESPPRLNLIENDEEGEGNEKMEEMDPGRGCRRVTVTLHLHSTLCLFD